MPPRHRGGGQRTLCLLSPAGPIRLESMAFLFLFIISCSARLRLCIWRRSFSAFGPEHVFVRVLTGRKGSQGQKTPVPVVFFSILTLCLLVSWRVFRPSPQGLSLSASIFPNRQAFPAAVKRRSRPSCPSRGFYIFFTCSRFSVIGNNLGLFVPKPLLLARLTLLPLTGLRPPV